MPHVIQLLPELFESDMWKRTRTYSDIEAVIDIIIMCDDGPCGTSVRRLADKWQWTTYRVRAFITSLADEGIISTKPGKYETTINLLRMPEWIHAGEQPQMPPTPLPANEPVQQELFPEITASDDPLSFSYFWDLYDKKVSKPKAERLYAELSLAERRAVIEYIPLYKAAIPDKKFRKSPDTFLRNRSWEDEIILHKDGMKKPATILTDNSESRFDDQKLW